MELKSSENLKLYGMSHFFCELSNLYNKKKLPTKILLSGKKGLGKSTLAYHFINYILSEYEDHKYDLKAFEIVVDRIDRCFVLVAILFFACHRGFVHLLGQLSCDRSLIAMIKGLHVDRRVVAGMNALELPASVLAHTFPCV